MIGDRAYDSYLLDQRLRQKYGIRLIAPHKYNRRRKSTQDGLGNCVATVGAGKSSASLPGFIISAASSAVGNIERANFLGYVHSAAHHPPQTFMRWLLAILSYWLGLVSTVLAFITRLLAAKDIPFLPSLLSAPGGMHVSYKSFFDGAILMFVIAIASSIIAWTKTHKA